MTTESQQRKPLPPDYAWLEEEKFPRILKEALKLYGIREKAGADNNPLILAWAEEAKGFLGVPYKADATAWCGLFVTVCALRAGYEPPKISLRAKEWVKFGAQSDAPKLGDILVFSRKGGGHVGFYIGQDLECFHVLGGNQGDAVQIDRIEKKRLITARECKWKIRRPDTLRPIFLDTGGAISHNEA